MKNYYTADNVFFLRTPQKSFDDYKDIFGKQEKTREYIERITDTNSFRERLMIASHNLLPEIINQKEKRGMLTQKTINSCAKYLIRESTRCTPYGLFSGVAKGVFSEKTNIILNDEYQDEKHARVDSGWLFCVVKEMEKEDDILFELNVRFNEMCYSKGPRMINPYHIQSGNDGQTSSLSIRNSVQVQNVYEKSKSFIQYKTLLNQLINENGVEQKEKINYFLKKLIEKEYLVTDLRPPLVNVDGLQYVMFRIKNIKSAGKWYNNFQNINVLIESYCNSNIGEGIEIYQEICKQMEKMYVAKDYLQVDLKKNMLSAQISREVKDEAERIINMLCNITDFNYEPSHLREYKQAFLEKYGYDVAIPIQQVLDNDTGLGAPAGYVSPKTKRSVNETNNYLSNFEVYLNKKIEDAIKDNNKEVIFSSEEVEMFGRKNDMTAKFPISLELYSELVAENQKAIDEGKFQLLLSGVKLSNGAGKTYGRFSRMFDDLLECELADKEKKLVGENTVFVEISEYPSSGRTGNVQQCNSGYDYQIALSTSYLDASNVLKLSDIYIGVDSNSNSFYIKSGSLDKRLIIKSNNMMNIRYGSNVFRFLREISCISSFALYRTIQLFENENRVYTPRIVFNHTILSPAHWYIDNELLTNDIKEFREFIERWEIPRYVYLEEGDNKLLLDLNNSLHIEILSNKANRKIKLVELVSNIDNTWLLNKIGLKYQNEMVFFLFRNQNEVSTRKGEQIIPLKHTNKVLDISKGLFQKNAKLLPGDCGWIYLKLYHNTETTNVILGEEIYDLCNKMIENGLVEKYFFIQYMDSNNHIRLRLKFKSELLQGVSEILEWANELKERELIYYFSIDTYEREVNRYGGSNLIEFAENCFWKDSELITNASKLDSIDDLEFGILNILSIMSAYGLNETEIEEWMSLNISNNNSREDFRKNRKKILGIIKDFYNQEIKMDEKLMELIDERNRSIYEYKNQIDKADKEGSLTNLKENILSSLIHMSCNRYKGDNAWENRIRTLTRHGIYTYIQIKKHHKF